MSRANSDQPAERLPCGGPTHADSLAKVAAAAFEMAQANPRGMEFAVPILMACAESAFLAQQQSRQTPSSTNSTTCFESSSTVLQVTAPELPMMKTQAVSPLTAQDIRSCSNVPTATRNNSSASFAVHIYMTFSIN